VTADRVLQRVSLLASIVRVVKNEGIAAKTTVWTSIASSLPMVVALCSIYQHQPVLLLRLMDLVNEVFESFGAHVVGAKSSAETISALVSLIGGGGGSGSPVPPETVDQLPGILANGSADPNSVAAICRVLDLLRVLAKEHAFARSLLPGALWLAYDRVHAISKAACWPHVSIQRSLVKLSAALLTHHQRELLDPRWFGPAMEALLAALHGKDVNAFRDALDALERLGTSGRLYDREVFRQQAWHHFATALLASVATKAHELRRDETIEVLHGLAAVNFQAFFQQLLPQFVLQQLAGLTQEQRAALLAAFTADTDLPTFAANACQLANDYSWLLRISNDSL
jgi:hypothetical protein